MPATLEEQPQTFTAFQGKVDAAKGVIEGVSIIQEGSVRTHGVYADHKTLKQVRDLAKSVGRLKAKCNHFSGIEATIGYYSDFRIREDKLLADLKLFDHHSGRNWLIEMSREIPELFGISISHDPDQPEEDQKTGNLLARIRRLFSADLVDNPAANRDGLFHEKIDKESQGMAKDTPPPDDGDNKKFVTVEQFKELKDAFAAFAAQSPPNPPTPTPTPPNPPAPTDPPQPPAPHEPKAFTAADVAAEVIKQIRLSQAAPTITNASASTSGTGDSGSQGAKPKTYAEARKEFIGDATKLDLTTKCFEWKRKYPTEAAWAEQTKATA